MSASEKSRPARQKDRFGLRPVGPGIVRGMVTNVREDREVTDFGELKVLEFDVVSHPDQPAVPVRMMGTDFSHELRAGMVVDIPDPAPPQRPLQPHRMLLSQTEHGEKFVAFYPGRYELPPAKRRLYATLIVGLPLLVTLALLIGSMYLLDLW